MIRHIAIFQLDEDKINDSLVLRIKEELEALVDKIPILQRMEVGINANPAEKQHLVLTADIDDMASVKTYANHPDHLEVAKLIKPIAVQRSCVDYIL